MPPSARRASAPYESQPRISPGLHTWRDAPSLAEAAAGDPLHRGHAGDSVRRVQAALRHAGADVEIDGLFGVQTRAAVLAFQRRAGLSADGLVGGNTLQALGLGGDVDTLDGEPGARARARASIAAVEARPAAPVGEESSQPPAGSVRVGDLDPSARTRIGRAGAAPAAGARDVELTALQEQTVDAARDELAAGVRERGQSNRGRRVDEYAAVAGMESGQPWCGYFVGFTYAQAARQAGGDFSGRTHLHSTLKARAYFLYENYVDNSRAERQGNALTRARHAAEGSSRRFMTFSGSSGAEFARGRGLPHEVYRDHRALPVRAGDMVIFGDESHMALVESYDAQSGELTIIEGNRSNRVQRRSLSLADPETRAGIEGFGRPARGDFSQPEAERAVA